MSSICATLATVCLPMYCVRQVSESGPRVEVAAVMADHSGAPGSLAPGFTRSVCTGSKWRSIPVQFSVVRRFAAMVPEREVAGRGQLGTGAFDANKVQLDLPQRRKAAIGSTVEQAAELVREGGQVVAVLTMSCAVKAAMASTITIEQRSSDSVSPGTPFGCRMKRAVQVLASSWRSLMLPPEVPAKQALRGFYLGRPPRETPLNCC